MNEHKDNISDKIKLLQALDQDIRENKEIDVSKGFRLTRTKIRKQSRKSLFLNTFNKAAAILLIPLLLSTGILLYTFHHNDEPVPAITYTEIMAAPGSIIKTQLPDNSEVWLNGGSKLRYPSWFSGERRSVELAGEAFFEVKTNPDFPFEVEISSGMKVLAKGTSFNINAYQDDEVHETTLRNGIVDMMYQDQTFSLLPSEMISLNLITGQIEKNIVNLDEQIAWKDGMLVFKNTPLEDVFKRLSRRYNVEFNIHNKSTVNYRVRATFTTETITQILDVLKLAAPITWSVKDMKQQDDLSFSRQHIDIVIK